MSGSLAAPDATPGWKGKLLVGEGVAGQLAAGANVAGTVLYDTLPAILGRAATSDQMDRAAELFFGLQDEFSAGASSAFGVSERD